MNHELVSKMINIGQDYSLCLIVFIFRSAEATSHNPPQFTKERFNPVHFKPSGISLVTTHVEYRVEPAAHCVI